ncbi:rhamnogalacturonase-like protein [Rickenella mellea]|uniref:Rhamnogalacturonase-like protein n=1 Tax=Rickenella mellea TaxID=50990 RepID=A0A4Y7PWH6_9AGAM|nr:rhamnogalacturonase-like protein [Rickenella mellea]
MTKILLYRVTALLTGYAALASAQLTGSVGPTTAFKQKWATICNVLDFGGELGSSDIGPAIGRAFTECVLPNPGSTLVVPEGNYNMSTWQTLANGKNWAFQMDGIITRSSDTGGHMIIIQNADDFEMLSSNSAGAIQGNGYLARNIGPRLLRIVTSTNWAVHDLIFVDSPEFHIVVQGGSNGEIYNLAIRGTNLGGSDGIDISGNNHWVHDVEVTNRDECVTVKSPASNFMIQRIWCNQSGGSAIGSLGSNTKVENITYRDVYTNGGNQMFMIKSNGGSGYVRNVLFRNFLGRGTAYGLDINQYWVQKTPDGGPGVQLSNITFNNWDGSVANTDKIRPPMQFLCADGAPCTDIHLTHMKMWADRGNATVLCQSAYGSGTPCLEQAQDSLEKQEAQTGTGTVAAYPVVTEVMLEKPSGMKIPAALPGDLAVGFATDAPIPIPYVPLLS